MRRPLLTAIIACAAFFAVAAPALASKLVISTMQDDNRLLYSSGATRDGALRRMKALGVDAVRATVLWDAVAPKRKIRNGQDPRSYKPWTWDKYDGLVRSAQALGIMVYLDVTPPGPRWTQSKANDPANQRAWKPNIREFGRFFKAVAHRYDGTYHDENQGKGVLPRVSWWGIGNEPNQGGWIMPQVQKIHGHLVPLSPGIYRNILVAGAKALIATHHGDDLINMGETAPLGDRPQSERRPLRPAFFLRELFCLDSHFHKYRGSAAKLRGCGNVKQLKILLKLPKLVYAHHPYTKRTDPSKRDRSRDSITVANLNSLPPLLDKLAKKTHLIPESLLIVLTEFGYETNPPDTFNGISLAKQAEWDNIGDYVAYRNDRVVANTQFLLFDVLPLKQYPRNTKAYWFTYQSGLYTAQGNPKPSAFAYMMPFIAKRAGNTANFWGQVRFTPNGVNQTVYLQSRQGGGPWQTQGGPIQVTNSTGFWEAARPASAGQIWRAVWVSPDNTSSTASREITLK